MNVIHITARFSQVHFLVKEFHYAGKGVLKFDLEMNLKPFRCASVVPRRSFRDGCRCREWPLPVDRVRGILASEALMGMPACGQSLSFARWFTAPVLLPTPARANEAARAVCGGRAVPGRRTESGAAGRSKRSRPRARRWDRGRGGVGTPYAARAAAIACRVPYSVTQATPTTAASASATVPDQPAEW